jgi:hypothetical protein
MIRRSGAIVLNRESIIGPPATMFMTSWQQRH